MLNKQSTPLVLLVSIVLLFSFLVGCRTSTITVTPKLTPLAVTVQSVSTSFANSILDNGCTTPCWIGIQVGITNFDEAKDMLILRYGVENVLIIDNHHISWKAVYVDGLSEGNIFFSGKNIVSEILLHPDTQANFSTEELLMILGEPTWVQVFQDPNNSCLGIDLIYSEEGVSVTLNPEGDLKGVQPSQNIFWVRILDTTLTENRVSHDSSLLKWDGFKDYCSS